MRAALPVVLSTAVALATTGCGSTVSSAPQPSSSPSAVTSSTPSGSSPRSTSTHRTPSNAPTEFNPPGDIPDTQVYVPFTASGRLRVKVPEGWGRRQVRGATVFSDHHNSISVMVVRTPRRPSAASRQQEVRRLARSSSKFALRSTSRVSLPSGPAFLVTYLHDSAVDPVTGKVVRDASLRFDLWHHGYEAILTLTGPTNADNVDPWHLVSQSATWLR